MSSGVSPTAMTSAMLPTFAASIAEAIRFLTDALGVAFINVFCIHNYVLSISRQSTVPVPLLDTERGLLETPCRLVVSRRSAYLPFSVRSERFARNTNSRRRCIQQPQMISGLESHDRPG